MKKFLVYTSIFTILVLLTLAGGEYVVQKQPNPYKYKHQYMLNNAHIIEYLIMGSSHTYYGVDPNYLFPNSFNIANVSQDYKYDLLLLEKYMPLCRNLHTVIIPVSYFSFFAKSFDDGDDWFYALNYKIYMDINIHSDFSKYNFEIFNRLIYSSKIKSYLFGKDLPTCDSLGFGIGYTLENRELSWENNSYITIERHTAKDWNALQENIMNLTKIIDLCQEKEIQLILFTPPSWHTYYNFLNNKQLTKTHEIIADLCQKYDVKYLDYLRDSRFNKDDFYDCDHLSNIGAIKFSTILRSDIESIKTR